MDVPTTMRAVQLTQHGGPEVLRVTEVATPTPGAGEVLVKVSAAALNNTDLWTREGEYGLPGPRAGWRGPLDFPRIQGADVAGYVAAVGDGVDVSILGSRVVIDPAVYDADQPDANITGLMGSERDGGYAEYVIAPADRIHDVTESPLSDDQLAALPISYGTALGMIERGRLQSGETVLVSGASGGVGVALVQLARARGARVIAISSGSKIQAVLDAGADVAVDRATDIAEQVRAAAPNGIDVVLDVVAGDLVHDGLPLLRKAGRWVVAGALGGHTIGFDVRDLYLHNLQLIGSTMHTPEHFELLMGMARRGEITPLVAATFPLAQAAEAQEELARRAHVGKIVLHP
ncbi:NADPH:quinone reductase-like Zn-dependent oxidoreductase [Salinibacterium amurskyense]|uniref:NADPH:quinone reductase-like Zn-dependent oxidoreductase n=1 Tax=Salinibacterium amurskyense TaxID=205941 RepID=A0A2M9D2J2_9MICO|nr:zinc-binding dehydrogenase [Salinibacterium amurskyense]PJJ78402.1 NADPH:quinone reductase-like Zn-dependent oxidoreductase [Salinibacterium amurskyense]RLQ80503.1 Zn-dependent oxidoreductase [Salinibacterium amurskyense]GHD83307.1 oxidoreductase [Salinibacterium amurskyense]